MFTFLGGNMNIRLSLHHLILCFGVRKYCSPLSICSPVICENCCFTTAKQATEKLHTTCRLQLSF